MAEHVELNLPLVPDVLSLSRLAVGTVGASMELTLDQIDDLQLAVDELSLLMLGDTPTRGGRLALRIEWDADSILVEMESTPSVEPPDADAHEPEMAPKLSLLMLDALADEHGVEERAGGSVGWLRYRRRPATDAP